MIRQFQLVEKVRIYIPDVDEDKLNRAYVFAMQAHGNQMRESGDPYFSHPLEVASILAELNLDLETIITGLLHDTVEDTSVNLDQIEKNFGKEVRTLVDGVTKLSQIQWQSKHEKQAENFRKLVLAMASDMRVLLVKLADRLHNMRTLHYVASLEKRQRISQETLDIYAPLAERIGIQHIKEELEKLAFAQLHPEAYESITARLHFLREKGKDTVDSIKTQILQLMKENTMEASLSGREKSIYSIWRKMRQRKVPFEQLTDIIAFRILLGTREECYRALGAVHGAFAMVPERFKDYISTPKPNNYQSLHTTVIGPTNHRIEIQIRTHTMHEYAENGVAAHWKYKQNTTEDKSEYRWLRGLLDILEHSSDPEEFLEHTKLEMFQDQVFCFTPAGDLISMPQGATVIDFAYAIHSDVGNHCVSGKIDGRLVPLRTVLRNGSQVEICTSKSQNPSPAWERCVVTGKARANIRRFIRTQQRDQYIILGKSILQKYFKKYKKAFSDRTFIEFLSNFRMKSLDELYASVGSGVYTAADVYTRMHPENRSGAEENAEQTQNTVPSIIDKASNRKTDKRSAIPLRGLIPGMAIHYAGCCHPLPGDRVVGIVQTGKGVTIHTRDCATLMHYESEPDRWLDVSWDSENTPESTHVGRLYVLLSNQSGALAKLSTVVSQQDANIINFKITNRTENFFDIVVDVDVKNADHLTDIIASLRSVSQIVSVERV
ncbi:MAG: bifunctional (p)ppGpp synthetase/guanosine-3',5'-bis(diphosphate) 3'-pyrophosphohydrolase [Alphaproteobacteria bacterium]|nr:MAG: bifunctional (p)ppGpp synthetase/guanosine-3',5'-bis(diphosphate) 3'-pyrophosphohydrolase [Alphaproteobacteria bacterium]